MGGGTSGDVTIRCRRLCGGPAPQVERRRRGAARRRRHRYERRRRHHGGDAAGHRPQRRRPPATSRSSLLTTCAAGQLLKWNGAAWALRERHRHRHQLGRRRSRTSSRATGSLGGGATGAVTSTSVRAPASSSRPTVSLDTAFTDGRYVNAAGGTMTGALDMGGQRVTNRGCPAGYVKVGPGLCTESADAAASRSRLREPLPRRPARTCARRASSARSGVGRRPPVRHAARLDGRSGRRRQRALRQRRDQRRRTPRRARDLDVVVLGRCCVERRMKIDAVFIGARRPRSPAPRCGSATRPPRAPRRHTEADRSPPQRPRASRVAGPRAAATAVPGSPPISRIPIRGSAPPRCRSREAGDADDPARSAASRDPDLERRRVPRPTALAKAYAAGNVPVGEMVARATDHQLPDRVRVAAANGLGTIATPEAAHVLVDQAARGDVLERRSAVILLQHQDVELAIPVLIDALADGDEYVRQNAVESLRARSRGRDFGMDAARWRTWWQSRPR